MMAEQSAPLEGLTPWQAGEQMEDGERVARRGWDNTLLEGAFVYMDGDRRQLLIRLPYQRRGALPAYRLMGEDAFSHDWFVVKG